MTISNSGQLVLLLLASSFCLSLQSPFKFPVSVKNGHGEIEWALNPGENYECMSLKDCATYTWMLDYENIQNEVIQITPKEVADLLKSKRCAIKEKKSIGGISMKTLVACPKKEEDDYNYYDEYDYEYGKGEDVAIGTRGEDMMGDDMDDEPCSVGDVENFLGGGLGTKLAKQEFECSLELTHGPYKDTLSSLKTVQFGGYRKMYRRLKKLENRKVLHIQAQGNCCWEIYQKAFFTGDIHHVEPGNSVYPVHQPRAIKKVCC